MMKLMSLIDRREDLSLDAFSRHWRTVHCKQALKLVAPGIMRGYVQNHRIDHRLDGLAPAGDGCPEVWIDGPESVERLRTCPEYLEGAALDEPNFMAGGARLLITTSQARRHAGERPAHSGAVRLLLFFNRAEGVDAGRLEAQWRDQGLLFPTAVEPVHAELETAIDFPPEVSAAQDFMGIESSWWPDLSALERAWAARDETRAAALIDIDSLAGMIVSEEVVFWPDCVPSHKSHKSKGG